MCKGANAALAAALLLAALVSCSRGASRITDIAPHTVAIADGFADPTSLSPLLEGAWPTCAVTAELALAYFVHEGPDGRPSPYLLTRIPSLRNGDISDNGRKLLIDRDVPTIGSLLLGAAPAPARQQPLTPGLYSSPLGHSIYVGAEDELPDPPRNEYFDSQTHRLYTAFPAKLTLMDSVLEDRRIIRPSQGSLGVSLWHRDGRRRSVIVLIHGNDPETREMGFLISFFAANGIDVVTYDQRGTGESSGEWSLNGPVQRALDVESIYDWLAKDPLVDPKRIGVWGFSNGGWTAPIVAAHRPIAFMILKSAPAETLKANIMYEVSQRMMRDHFRAGAIDRAREAWCLLIESVHGSAPWRAAQKAYNAAEKEPWFDAAFLPPHLKFPLSPATAAGLRRATSYNPGPTLREVTEPTLALFGALDRNVDVKHAAPTFSAAFARSGMTDFTERIYPGAGHTLKASRTGYNGDFEMPERFVIGYPEIMLDWLRKRGML
jgi:alpha-beta hydrolase superfamily lysophospholipase